MKSFATRRCCLAVLLFACAPAFAGQASYQALQTGNPGTPGDGVFVSPPFDDESYELKTPYPIVGIDDGVMFTLFPKAPVQFTVGADWDRVGFQLALPDLSCYASTGLPINGLVTVKGAAGGYAFLSLETMQSLYQILQQYCSTATGVGFEQLVVKAVSAIYTVTDGSEPPYAHVNDLDALALGLSSQAVPGKDSQVADLKASISEGLDPIAPGAGGSLFFDVQNIGSKPAKQATAKATLPDNVQIGSIYANGWNCSKKKNQLECVYPSTIPGGGYKDFYVDFQAPAEPQVLTAKLKVGASNDADSSNNTAVEKTTVSSCTLSQVQNFLLQYPATFIVDADGSRQAKPGLNPDACRAAAAPASR
ncbi:hypothetical protein [Hydrocarboniphaga sp.]|uniref:hypothetical protein n=1 Tax=Hydrocarboniphaga sp. TaxID=2033016 RepID=UPI003D0D177A